MNTWYSCQEAHDNEAIILASTTVMACSTWERTARADASTDLKSLASNVLQEKLASYSVLPFSPTNCAILGAPNLGTKKGCFSAPVSASSRFTE